MKVLRAIGKGDINIAITHDLQMISSLEADRRQIRQNEPYISPLRIASPIDELSYVQFFNELVFENNKKRRRRRNREDLDKLPELQSKTPNKKLSEVKVTRKL